MPWYEAVGLVLTAISKILDEYQEAQKNKLIDDAVAANTDASKLDVATRIAERLRESG